MVYESLEPRQLLAADFVISEFVASNGTSLIDGNGSPSDWIEIHNQGDTAGPLDNYFLTDDSDELNQWRFPTGTSLGADEYLIVFASGNGVPDSNGNLHASFKLAAGGEYVALVEGVGLPDPPPPFSASIDFTQESINGLAHAGPSIQAISGDLLESGLASVTFDDATGQTTAPGPAADSISRLTDGAIPTFLPSGSNGRTLYAGSGDFVEFTLDTSVNTNGYDIDSVNTIGSWSDRTGQAYQLQIRRVGDVGFSTIYTLNGLDNDGFVGSFSNSVVNEVSISNSNSGAIAEGVAAIRFIFLNDDIAWNTYREIDVTGQPSTPALDPSAITYQVVSEFGADGADYPPQFQDTAYGIGLTSNTGYLFTPTPGAANGLSTPDYSERAVVFSRAAGTFSDPSFSLSLSTDTAGGVIVYTTNGVDPTTASTVYSGPITISNSTEVRARVVTIGPELGPIFGSAYTKLASNVTLTSRLPIVVLDNFGGGAVSNSFEDFSFSLFDVDPGTGVSSLEELPAVATPSAIHVRGTSSASRPKKQYRLELRDQYGDDQDFSLLGLPAESDWVLFAHASDRSLTRDPLAYQLGRESGLESPNTRYVEVYLRQSGTNSPLSDADYAGVYSIRENIKIGSNRLDITSLSPADVVEPDITGGYLLRFDVSNNVGPNGLVLQTSDGHPLQLVDGQNYTLEQNQWISDHIAEFVSVLNGPNFADPVNGYAKYIDVESFINLMLINELSREQDSYFRSNYLHKDRGGKLTQGPLWDYNFGFGDGFVRDAKEIAGWQYDANDGFLGSRWIQRLIQDPAFELKFRDRWSAVRQDVYSLENINNIIDGNAATVGVVAAGREFVRWRNSNADLWIQNVESLKQWIADRVAWLDSQLLDPQTPVFSPAGGAVPVNSTVSISSPSTFTEVPLVGTGSPALGLVPTDASLETGPGLHWYERNFDASGWQSGTNGVGYDRNSTYGGLIGTNVRAQWDALAGQSQGQSSVYARFEFELTELDPSSIDNLLLRINADDGFIAYLNGQRIADRGDPGNVNWQSNTTLNRSDSVVVAGEDFDVTAFKNLLLVGNNVLAVHGLNNNDSSSDLLVRPQLIVRTTQGSNPVYYTTNGSDPRNSNGTISSSAILYTGPITISNNVVLSARALPGGSWTALKRSSFVAGSLASQSSLRVTEINYNPSDATTAEIAAYAAITNTPIIDVALSNDDFEFIEIYNPSSTGTINLAGMQFTAGINYTFGDVNLLPGERGVIVEDLDAFTARYGTNVNVLGQWSGGLNGNGEKLTLVDSASTQVQSISYNDSDPWSISADGAGATLVLTDPAGTPANQLGKYYRWRGSAEPDGTPGTGSASLRGVVINEVLAHTDLPQFDSIELFNPTGSAVDISGWYLSDAANTLQKFEIPAGTILAAGAYVVFNETDFNPTPLTPGPNDFALNGSAGDQVYLTVPDGLAAGEFVDAVEFGGSYNGQTFGRVPDGSGRLAPLVANTLGSSNSVAKIGPLVISEVNYHPGTPSTAALGIEPALTDDDLEFIEIHNPTSVPISLTGRRLRGEADYDFASGTTLGVNQTLVVVSFDPSSVANTNRLAAFRAHYGIGTGVVIVGEFSGNLSNGSGRVELQTPDAPPLNDPTLVPHITTDEVLYDDLSPWANADGSGSSLNRLASNTYGNAAGSWQAASPSPGSASVSSFAPTVVSTFRNEGGVLVRPDLWSSLTVVFDSDVSVSANSLTMLNDTLGGNPVSLSGVEFAYNPGTFTATWTFGGLSVPLQAAHYTYRLDASSITTGSSELDGDDSGIAGDDFVEQQYVAIPGDLDFDGRVDIFGDGFLFLGNIGTASGAIWSDGDFNADGKVDVFGDGFKLLNNLGRDVRPSVGAPTAMTLPATPLNSLGDQETEDIDIHRDRNVSRQPATAASETPQLTLAGDQDLRDDLFATDY